MSNKVIWSTNASADYAKGLDDEAKRNYLIDRGYEPEMLTDVDLDSVITDDDYMWQDDVEEFESEIVPMINNQTKDGIVLMVGTAGRWDGNHPAGKAAYADELSGGDIDPDVNNVEIIDDGEGLAWLGHHHDGTHDMKLFAIPEDEGALIEFVSTCMTDAIDEDEDPTSEIEFIATNLDPEMITDYCDFSKVPEVCERIKANGAITEEQINEVASKNPREISKEYKELKKLSDEYGYYYFTEQPFSNYKDYDGEDDIGSIEYQYPEFARIVKAFFTEMGVATKAEVQDPDTIDELWYTSPSDDIKAISQHDWDTLMETMRILQDRNTIQIEKIYKNGFDDGLKSDDEIKAEREKQDELAAEYGDELNEDQNLNGKNILTAAGFNEEQGFRGTTVFEYNLKDKFIITKHHQDFPRFSLTGKGADDTDTANIELYDRDANSRRDQYPFMTEVHSVDEAKKAVEDALAVANKIYSSDPNKKLTEANEEGAWFGPRTDYTVKIQKVKPGTKVHNKLENANYVTDEKKCYVITGTVGEQWPVDAKKVQQKYICDMQALEAGKPVEAKINPEAVKGDKGYFTVCKQPMEVNTDWGDILHAEPGDMLRSDGPGQEPNRVVDQGVFKTTYQKLEGELNEDDNGEFPVAYTILGHDADGYPIDVSPWQYFKEYGVDGQTLYETPEEAIEVAKTIPEAEAVLKVHYEPGETGLVNVTIWDEPDEAEVVWKNGGSQEEPEDDLDEETITRLINNRGKKKFESVDEEADLNKEEPAVPFL